LVIITSVGHLLETGIDFDADQGDS